MSSYRSVFLLGGDGMCNSLNVLSFIYLFIRNNKVIYTYK